MRITREAKQQNRERILQQACRLFCESGYHQTTTRDIAVAADIATGTLFNYFASKELLGLTLIRSALADARDEAAGRLSGGESLEEELFAHVAAALRHLRPHRAYAAEVFDGAMSPLSRSLLSDAGADVRADQLEIVGSVLSRRGIKQVSPMTLHLYWTLYLGVLSFWAADESPGHEDTLALLDEVVTLFARSVDEPVGKD